MRLLLDENVPVALRHYFPKTWKVETVAYRGWEGLSNGELLEAAAAEYDAFLTIDTGIPYQQKLDRFDVQLVMLRLGTDQLDEIVQEVPRITAALRFGTEKRLIVIASVQ